MWSLAESRWTGFPDFRYSGPVKHPGILNDVLFRIVFGTQSGEPVLRALVNALLDLSGDNEITELTLVNPISEKDYVDDKGPILDLKARDNLGRQYNVEVQLRPGVGDYLKRSIYYLTRFFSEQIQRGDSYHQLLKTVSITLLDFNLLEESEQVHSTFVLREKTTGLILSDVLELHYVELRKFKPSKPSELRTRFERWLYFLKFADLFGPEDQTLPENLAQEKGIAMALESMRRAYAKDPVREMIEAREKAERDEISRLHTARLEGKLEGKLEGQLELARGLLLAGVDRATILSVSGLSDADLGDL